MLCRVVRALGATAKNDVHVLGTFWASVSSLASRSVLDPHLITARLDDGGKTLLGDAHEGVWVGAGAHRIYSHGDLRNKSNKRQTDHNIPRERAHTAVGAVLETDREGHAARKLAVELRLSCPRANGSPGNEVGDVLW